MLVIVFFCLAFCPAWGLMFLLSYFTRESAAKEES